MSVGFTVWAALLPSRHLSGRVTSRSVQPNPLYPKRRRNGSSTSPHPARPHVEVMDVSRRLAEVGSLAVPENAEWLVRKFQFSKARATEREWRGKVT